MCLNACWAGQVLPEHKFPIVETLRQVGPQIQCDLFLGVRDGLPIASGQLVQRMLQMIGMGAGWVPLRHDWQRDRGRTRPQARRCWFRT